MVKLIMGEKGTGKTKKLIELINASAAEAGNVVCIEAKSAMTFDVHHHARLVTAEEYAINSYDRLRGFVSGLYAGNYDTSYIFIDNLFKLVGGSVSAETDAFLAWLAEFSDKHDISCTITMSADPALATETIKKYL